MYFIVLKSKPEKLASGCGSLLNSGANPTKEFGACSRNAQSLGAADESPFFAC
jgi:hypothetical protein